MTINTYLYIVITCLAVCASLFIYFNLKSNKNNENNKILLKNLLESFELDLPDELKRLDTSSTDSRKLS